MNTDVSPRYTNQGALYTSGRIASAYRVFWPIPLASRRERCATDCRRNQSAAGSSVAESGSDATYAADLGSES